MNLYDVIKRPLVTEKGMQQVTEENCYSFAVDPKADKIDVRRAVEKLFKVTVLSVRTLHRHPKMKRVGRSYGRAAHWKKVYVTLKEGDKIELMEAKE